MKIVLAEVFGAYTAAPLDYMLARLGTFDHIGFPSTEPFTKVVESWAIRDIPLVPENQFPTLTATQASTIEKAKACAKNGIEEDYPLLPGEIVQEEAFSYLSAPFVDQPAGTGVLRQRTNYALIYFFFDNTLIRDGSLTYVPAPNVLPTVSETRAPLVTGVATTLALSLAKGLLGGIGKEIGALICNEIFSATGLDYFEPTEQTLKKIVNEEITSAVITQIDAKINGTKDWIRVDYTPQKESYQQNHDPQTLVLMQQALTDYCNDMYTQVIGPLKEDRYAKPGFAVFLIGAGVHIALYQERALVDNRVKDPALSTYASSVKTLGQDYATFAQATYDKLIESRKNMISCKQQRVCSYAGGYPVCNEFWAWYDKYTDERREFSPDKDHDMNDCEKQCKKSMQAHTDEALKKLNTDLGDPNTIIPDWRKLVNQPIPKV